MDRSVVTQKIIEAKVKRGLKWAEIAKVIGDMACGSLTSENLNNVKLTGHTRALIGSLEE